MIEDDSFFGGEEAKTDGIDAAPPPAKKKSKDLVTIRARPKNRYRVSDSLVIDDVGTALPRHEAEAILASANAIDPGLVYQVNNAKEGE